MSEKSEKMVEDMAKAIFVGYNMEFGSGRDQRRECFSASEERKMWTREWEGLSSEDKRRWKVVARGAIVRTFIQAVNFERTGNP